MNGVCQRWAVVRKANLEPIEGTLYSEWAKANKRRVKTHDPQLFEVIQVAVMPLDVAHRIIEAIQ